jgi:hypothetical protein
VLLLFNLSLLLYYQLRAHSRVVGTLHMEANFELRLRLVSAPITPEGQRSIILELQVALDLSAEMVLDGQVVEGLVIVLYSAAVYRLTGVLLGAIGYFELGASVVLKRFNHAHDLPGVLSTCDGPWHFRGSLSILLLVEIGNVNP